MIGHSNMTLRHSTFRKVGSVNIQLLQSQTTKVLLESVQWTFWDPTHWIGSRDFKSFLQERFHFQHQRISTTVFEPVISAFPLLIIIEFQYFMISFVQFFHGFDWVVLDNNTGKGKKTLLSDVGVWNVEFLQRMTVHGDHKQEGIIDLTWQWQLDKLVGMAQCSYQTISLPRLPSPTNNVSGDKLETSGVFVLEYQVQENVSILQMVFVDKISAELWQIPSKLANQILLKKWSNILQVASKETNTCGFLMIRKPRLYSGGFLEPGFIIETVSVILLWRIQLPPDHMMHVFDPIFLT